MASAYESVMQAIVGTLSSIEAGSNGYVYTPESVRRLTWFPVDWQPDPSYRTQYIVSPGDETLTLGPDSCSVRGEAEVFIVLFRKKDHTDPSDDCAIANDLVADCSYALFDDPQFDGTAVLIVGGLTVDRSPGFEYPGFVAAGVRFVVRYQTDSPGR